MEETFQEVTITPIRRSEEEPFRYRLLVNGNPPRMWTSPGIYNTPEEVIASFTPPLRIEYQTGILNSLREGQEVKFSLKDAFAPL